MSDGVAEASVRYFASVEKQPIVPAGYKQTEVGFIPEEWDLLRVEDISSFSGGSQPPRSTFISIPKEGYIRLIQIRDYKTSKYETYIPENLAQKKCLSTDIMIGRYGPPIFQILSGIEGAYNVALIKAEPKTKISRTYLYYFLKSEKLFDLMEMLSQRSSGQTGIELPALKAYPIPLPPKKEQTAIANALSDVDALIHELEKLIAKKQAIKTATMQQLLTGKTRLPPFARHPNDTPATTSASNPDTATHDPKRETHTGPRKGYKQSELGEIPEDWEVRCLGDYCTYLGSGKTSTRSDGEYPLYGSTGRIGSCKIPEYFGDAILVARVGANAGRLNFVNGEYGVSDNTIIVKLDKNTDLHFIKYWLIRMNLNTLVFGSGQPLITGTQLKELLISLPGKQEQSAIATIISNMDDELHALEQRLSKTRQIKQGMMQELLTGKTRLIKPEAVA